MWGRSPRLPIRLDRRIGLCLLALMLGGPAAADNRIRILCPTWSGFAPVFVGLDLGYFQAEGLAVDMKFEDERPNVMAAMDRAEIEMDMRTVGEYQGRPRTEATPGVIIGTIDQSLGADGVIADGSVATVADLKGKAVAAEPNVPGRLLLQMALHQAGSSLSDLQVKEIVTADTVPVFADPSIAAIVTFEPFLSQTLKTDTARRPHLLLSSRDLPGLIADSIIVRQDDLHRDPDKYRRYLKALYKAIRHYETDPEDFVRRAAPHYNLSPEDFKASIDGSLVYTSLATTQAAFGRPEAPGPFYAVFDTVMALNLENGAADQCLAAAKSIDNSVLAGLAAADLQ